MDTVREALSNLCDELIGLGFNRQEDWFVKDEGEEYMEQVHIDTLDMLARCRIATAALASQEAQSTGEWQLVPKRPTPEMLSAAVETAGMKAAEGIIALHEIRAGRLYDKAEDVPPWPGGGSVPAQVYRAMLAAAPAQPPHDMSREAGAWVHVKSQGRYELLHRFARLEWAPELGPHVVYRSLDTESVWVRPSDQFFDGRFAPPQPADKP